MVTVAAPTPPETPLCSGVDDGATLSPQFVYVSTDVEAGPLTPPASEYSSDAENTPTDANGPNTAATMVGATATTVGATATTIDATATATTTVYGLIDYVIERSGGIYDPLLSKDLNADKNNKKASIVDHCSRSMTTTSTTPTTTQEMVSCNSSNRG